MSFTSQLTRFNVTGEQSSTASNIIYVKRDEPRAKCGYLSKPCDKLRAVKRNGDLHRFCEEHAAGVQLPPSELLVRLDLDDDELNVLAQVLDVSYD
ncbi:hypothetical protein Gpo141_00003502 [Globisporangium polare]